MFLGLIRGLLVPRTWGALLPSLFPLPPSSSLASLHLLLRLLSALWQQCCNTHLQYRPPLLKPPRVKHRNDHLPCYKVVSHWEHLSREPPLFHASALDPSLLVVHLVPGLHFSTIDSIISYIPLPALDSSLRFLPSCYLFLGAELYPHRSLKYQVYVLIYSSPVGAVHFLVDIALISFRKKS